MFLFDGPEDARQTILLAHGAGAAMDSGAMTTYAQALSDAGFRVARFEFSYMAERRSTGTRKPPPKAELLMAEFRHAVKALGPSGGLIIGGKSMGGRVASLVADELHAEGEIRGLLCIGYPFHPPGKPESLRTAHLERLATPALICQGTRDIFGTDAEVAGYSLAPTIRVAWFEDGDHDLKPRKAVSGFTAADHVATLAATVRLWADGL